MKVVPFPAPNLANIPAMARKFADDLEAGKYGDVSAAVLVIHRPSGGVASFGWGDIDDRYAVIGMLEAAKHSHAADMVDE